MGVQPETKIFLKYKRKKECWVCSFCDTENENNKCYLCGALRRHDSVVRPTWDNMIHSFDKVVPERGNDMPEIQYDYSENKGVGNVVGLIVAWVVIIFILILIIVNFS